MDLDLDDLGAGDAPAMPATRPSRFQPKAGKLKAKPKAEKESEPAPDAPPPPPKKKEEEAEVSGTSFDSEVKRLSETKEESTLKMKAAAAAEEEQVEEEPMEEDDDEEEDRVVREIDVFLCPPLDSDTQLYVLQYPLRPRWRPYELDRRCQEVRLRPQSSQLEIDLSLDMDNNYDVNVADNMRITKQTLTSWKPPLATSYAVGHLIGNKLHLNPIHAVVQLRPSMEHLKGGSKKRNEVAEEQSDGSSKKQSWVSLEYHGIESSMASRYREKMVSQNDSLIQFSMSMYDYVNSLCPVSTLEGDKMRRPSRRLLLSLPLEERVKTLLSKGPQMFQFKFFRRFAPDDSENDILAVLQHHAYLIQGLWVPKSPLLQHKGDVASARDYILLLFSKSAVITKEQLKCSKINLEVFMRVLNLLAIGKPSLEQWKFKETDELFLKSHPRVVRDQEQVWMNCKRSILIAVGREEKETAGRKAFVPTMAKMDGVSGNIDQGVKSGVNGKPSLSSTTMTDENREALRKALMEVFRQHKVCSLQLISQSLREKALAKHTDPKTGAGAVMAAIAAKAASDHPQELQSIVRQVATNIHGVYVANSSDNPALNPLRKVVITLFSGKPLNAGLKKADVIEAAKISLKKDFSNTEYDQVMRELCIYTRGAWVLKSGDRNPQIK